MILFGGLGGVHLCVSNLREMWVSDSGCDCVVESLNLTYAYVGQIKTQVTFWCCYVFWKFLSRWAGELLQHSFLFIQNKIVGRNHRFIQFDYGFVVISKVSMCVREKLRTKLCKNSLHIMQLKEQFFIRTVWSNFTRSYGRRKTL